MVTKRCERCQGGWIYDLKCDYPGCNGGRVAVGQDDYDRLERAYYEECRETAALKENLKASATRQLQLLADNDRLVAEKAKGAWQPREYADWRVEAYKEVAANVERQIQEAKDAAEMERRKARERAVESAARAVQWARLARRLRGRVRHFKHLCVNQVDMGAKQSEVRGRLVDWCNEALVWYREAVRRGPLNTH